MNNTKPGILVINVLHYTGEWMGTTEGTKYLVPFAASNRPRVEKLAETFNRVRKVNDEAYETDMEILDADTIKEALYGCRIAQQLDSSVVDMVVSSKTITATQAKDLETRIQDPVYDNMDTYVLNYKLEALFDEYWGKYRNKVGFPSY
jgi:hypothetical protein